METVAKGSYRYDYGHVDLDFEAYFVNYYQAFRFLHLKVTGIILVSKMVRYNIATT